jgi:glycosyltransferase involved in cell wall biosynthesis
MRILNVISSIDPSSGGTTEAVRQQSAALEELGHCVEVVTCDDPKERFGRDFPVEVHSLGPQKGTFGYTPQLAPWLRENVCRFDAVIAHGLWQYTNFAVWRTMTRLKRPYLVFCHGMLDPWFKEAFPLKHLKKSIYWYLVESWVLRAAAAVVFTCDEERLLARQSFSFYHVKEKVVTLGISDPVGDLDSQGEAFLESFSSLRDKRFLLFLSRIHPKKGCDLLVQTFAEAAEEDKDLLLVMAGPDQIGWMWELKELASRLGVGNRIVWTGMLLGDLKWGAYHLSKALILPSHQENFGIVVAEALACSRPVLISQKVNIWREVVEDGAGIAKPDDLEGTRELLQLWQSIDETERQQMSINARHCFETRFEVMQAAVSLVTLLEEIC